MANILDMFGQVQMLDYLKARTYDPFLGQTLFPAVKKPTLKFEYIRGAGNSLPTIASVHAFNTESEIASRSAEKQALEAALIKRKIGMDEEMIMALERPRDSQEESYLKTQVFNDTDEMVRAVESRIELMRIEALTKGRVTLDENGLNKVVDYRVPAENKQVLSGTSLWTDPASDPLADILRWATALNGGATRVLTSSSVVSTLLSHPKVISGIFGNGSGKFLSGAELNNFLAAHQLPRIAVYDAKYKKENANGTKTIKRYLDANTFTLFGDGALGQTIYGPTPEEIRLRRDSSVDMSKVGNVLAMVYEEGRDPVGTWTKAVATAVPSFPAADEVFQAQPIV